MTNNPIAAAKFYTADGFEQWADYVRDLRDGKVGRGMELLDVEMALRQAAADRREYDDANGREDQPVAQAVPIILRSDLDAIRKALQEEMLRVPDVVGGMRVETYLQLDPGRKDYGWLYALHADGKWVTIAKLDGFSIAMIQHQANAVWRRVLDRATATANGTGQPAGPQPPHSAPED